MRRTESGRTVLLLGVLLLAQACGDPFGPPRPPPSPPQVRLTITSVTPSSTNLDGGQPITVITQHGCVLANLTITIAGAPIDSVKITSTSLGTYTFPAPPAPPGVSQDMPTKVTLAVTCAKPAEPNVIYAEGGNTASAAFTYDPCVNQTPVIESYEPTGSGVPRVTVMKAKFSCPMNKDSVERAGNVSIQGVQGTTTYDPSTRTATFTPSEFLAAQMTYTCVVVGGPPGSGGVESESGGQLETHLYPAGATQSADEDSWTFTTQ